MGSLPLFNQRIDLPPATKVEIPNAEIRTLRYRQSLAKCGQQLSFDIVKNPWHRASVFIQEM